MWTRENSVIYVGRVAQSVWMTDFSYLSTWMTELSVTRMLRAPASRLTFVTVMFYHNT
jgi:hypothetical protein